MEEKILFETIKKNLKSALIVFDKNDNVVFINDRGEELLKDLNISSIEFKDKILELERISTESRKEIEVNNIIIGYNLEKIKHGSELDREIIIFQDITEVKEKERKINGKKQRELLGELAMYIAHEVKNSLNIIRGYSQLMLESNKLDDIRENLNIFIEETDRLNKLTHSILDYTKKTSLELEKTDLIEFTVEFLEKTFKNENINLMTKEKHLDIFIDRDKIIQVYLNIIQNGLEAIESNGIFNIYIEKKLASRVEVVFETDGKLSDSFEVEKLFVESYTTKKEGNGLGLMICKNIIEEHLGKIRAYRNSFGGLSIVLEFPQRFHK